MRILRYIIIYTSCVLTLSADDRPDPLSTFKNSDKISKYYEELKKEELKNFDHKAHDEKMWMYTSAKKWENQDDLKPEEIERLWDNFRTGEEQRKYLAFAWISYFEPLEKWLPDLKALNSSDTEDDQLAAFQVIDAYAQNDYGRFREKEIFADPEVLEAVENYTEQFKDKDKYFKKRLKKLQNSVVGISQNLSVQERVPKGVERPEKALPNRKQNVSESKNGEASETAKTPWLWVIGILLLVAIILFLMKVKSNR